jgi:hypothetical protein
MDPSDSSPGPKALARALCPGCGCYPLRTRSPVFSSCPSRRAVPATPSEQTGAHTDSCRPVLPSPPLQWLGLTVSLYEATSGFTHITARHFAAADCTLRRSSPASAGYLAAPHSGPGFPIVGSCRDGLLSFHRVSRRFARRTERVRVRGGRRRDSGGPSPLPLPARAGRGRTISVARSERCLNASESREPCDIGFSLLAGFPSLRRGSLSPARRGRRSGACPGRPSGR